MVPSTGLPLGALALQAEFKSGKARDVGCLPFGGFMAEMRLGGDSLWAIIDGVAALRCAWAPGPALELQSDFADGEYSLSSSLGTYRVHVWAPDPHENILRIRTTLTPRTSINVGWWPLDLYPLGPGNDPSTSKGEVLAAQRGYHTGLLFVRRDGDDRGSIFYQQDLTALNDYFNLTNTQPDGVIGGAWPELGYNIPRMQEAPLPEGKEVVLYETIFRLSSVPLNNRQEEAAMFLEHQAAIYPLLIRPEPHYHDWPKRAELTLQDLQKSNLVTVNDGGYTYLRPYVEGEVPDSVVQITLTSVLRQYGAWMGETPQFAEDLRAGVYRFFDPEIGAIRRYLNTVGPEKDSDQVDSWYLFHPLLRLAEMVRQGDDAAKRLFLDSIDYAIHTAKAFKYSWPIKFKMSTREVVLDSREPEQEVGQTDVAGLYAYVMLDAYELIGDAKYLEEAKQAVRKTQDLGFEIAYQLNITALGTAACLRLWKVTEDRFFLDQAWVFLASYIHNTALWSPDLGKVRENHLFFAVSCLHNGPYIAPFECFESYAAFRKCLEVAEDDLPDSVKLLMSEFMRYAHDRAWWFYPSELEETSLAHSPRNGKIVRSLAFPVEDLYLNGDPAGQVGQEVYGSGLAFTLAMSAYTRLPNHCMLYCEYPVRYLTAQEEGIEFRVIGCPGTACHAQLLPPDGSIVTVDGHSVSAERFEVPVGAHVHVQWPR